ncbi:glyoxalase I-like protein [Zea mays]|nr:glyoxalase I-like protein [Zea mays]
MFAKTTDANADWLLPNNKPQQAKRDDNWRRRKKDALINNVWIPGSGVDKGL